MNAISERRISGVRVQNDRSVFEYMKRILLYESYSGRNSKWRSAQLQYLCRIEFVDSNVNANPSSRIVQDLAVRAESTTRMPSNAITNQPRIKRIPSDQIHPRIQEVPRISYFTHGRRLPSFKLVTGNQRPRFM